MSRTARTRSTFVAVSVLAACAGLGALASPAQAATVTVSTAADLATAVKNATPGTVIQIRGGTYYPTATLQSTANGTSASRIQLRPYGSETVRIDGSQLPAGSWIFKLTADYWSVADLTFQNSPDSAVVCTSCTGTTWDRIRTINGGDSGFTLTGADTNDNTVRNLDSSGHYDAANHGENADGLAVKFGSGTGNLITGARLSNNSDDGVDLWSWSSPLTIEHSWAYGNGRNRWSDSAFAGDGNGYKLGGDGEVVAHVVNNSAAWDNAGNGFTENSNRGAIQINRTTSYANGKKGYYFATGAARLGKNLAVSNGTGSVSAGSSVVSAGNNWDSGIATPAFLSTDPASAYGARKADGSLPSTAFLTTGSTTIGSTMN
ncbi:right-handed parallel beta-helix repeat-containing protein [Streptomyces sp. NBC_00572]|uniref:right-handed parallel beta-helix repeat-containing protein n=1 Tax=Streptomyces sp. NBC_00572 TaxID=2903664 RepID=UPI00225437F4|nr:right-handed parallel beta-helix repeat-containing protein [Streptomyces sp. NBC_00572]MCX4984874.1 right-handed parallel beta-helix repeat-containing protein [Streptomyces sp. NBC_00572]